MILLLLFMFRPTRVLANVGRQRFHDRPVFPFTLLGNIFERVDTAQAHLRLITAELLDSLGEAFRDPAFKVRLGLFLVALGGCFCLCSSHFGLLQCRPSGLIGRARPDEE